MVSKTDEIPTAVPKAAEPHREETQEGASIIKKKESCGCGKRFLNIVVLHEYIQTCVLVL